MAVYSASGVFAVTSLHPQVKPGRWVLGFQHQDIFSLSMWFHHSWTPDPDCFGWMGIGWGGCRRPSGSLSDDPHTKEARSNPCRVCFRNCFCLFGASLQLPLSDSTDRPFHLSLEFLTSGILSFSLQMSEETGCSVGDGVSAAPGRWPCCAVETLGRMGPLCSQLRLLALRLLSGSGEAGVLDPPGAFPLWCVQEGRRRARMPVSGGTCI